jgi:hypothetical protein
MSKRGVLANVWSAPCPKCHAWVGSPCRDMRSQTGLLFGRRTHQERKAKVKESIVASKKNPTGGGWTVVPATRIWQSWMGGEYVVTTNATTTTGGVDYVWDTWNTTTSSTTLAYNYQYTWQRWEAARADVEELQRIAQARLDAEQRRREETNARRLAARARVEGAEERSMELFRSLLDVEQLAMLDNPDTNCVIVRGSSGGRYQLECDHGVHGNIVAIDEHGCMLGRLCVAPQMWSYGDAAAMPHGDGLVGQLLAIRFNEPALLAQANWSHRRPCQRPDGVPEHQAPFAVIAA